MKSLTLTRVHAFVLIFLLWSAIYLPNLGAPEFKGEEGRRVLPAVTMLETGDWIVPYVGGQAYLNKPPLINWLVAVSFLMTGDHNEASARLPSALFVLGFVSLLIGLRGEWLSLNGRIIAAVVFLTNIGILEKGRLIEIEAVYTCLTGMAILWWLDLWSQKSSPWLLWIIPSVLLGCGMLTKGPLILLVFYCTVGSVVIYNQRFKELLSLWHLLGILLIVGMFVGWSLLAVKRGPGGEMIDSMSAQMSGRIFRPDIDFGKWAKNIINAFRNFLPWLIFLPFLWKQNYLASIAVQDKPLFKGCRTALVISFVLINLMPGTMARYSVPVIGLASILMGWILSLNRSFGSVDKWWQNILLYGLAFASVTAVVGLVLIKFNSSALVVTVLTGCLCILFFRSRETVDTPFRLTLLTGVFVAALMLQYSVYGAAIMPKYEKRRTVGAAINNLVPSEEVIYVFKPGYQAFLFYVRPPVRYLVQDQAVDKNVRFLVLRQKDYDRLKSNELLSDRSPETLLTFTYRHKGDFRLLQLAPLD